MKKATIVFCIKGDQVLLAKKTRKVGAGKWNGYGGKVDEGETSEVSAIRELGEESVGIVAEGKDLEQVASVSFSFDGVPTFECSIYFLRKWQGDPQETPEMASPTWFPIADMPFMDMMAADRIWIPLVFEGKKIRATVNFSQDGSEVKEFQWQPAIFS